MEHVGVDCAPVVWEGVAPQPFLAEPVANSVAYGNVVDVARGLLCGKRLYGWQEQTHGFETTRVTCCKVHLAQELRGRGDDALLIVHLMVGEVQSVLYEYVSRLTV